MSTALVTIPDMSTYAGQAEHYQAVRNRLFNSCQPPRPDVTVAAADALPMVRITEENRKRVRDTLYLMTVNRQDIGFVEDETPDWRDIVSETMAKHGVSRTELMSGQRSARIVAARHEVFYRLSKETIMSLPQIARRIGNKDHTTVLHGIRKHAERMAAQ